MSLPARIDWRATPHEQVAQYAVFIDRAPIPRGRDIRWLAERADDTTCLAQPGCPDDSWLRSKGVYLTTETSFTIGAIAPKASYATREVHEVAVVPLDRNGRRIGEVAALVEIVVDRESER